MIDIQVDIVRTLEKDFRVLIGSASVWMFKIWAQVSNLRCRSLAIPINARVPFIFPERYPKQREKDER